MKKRLFAIAVMIIFAACMLCMSGCGDDKKIENESPVAKAPTGTYTGHTNDGVQEFLGIRYAAPVERWKAPEDVATTTEDEIDANEWGPCCIQPYDEVEVASQGELSEDCLNLNIWTKDVNTKDKPVMVFIHGGGYMNGGSNDPLYYGDEMVRNLPENEDMVFVSINYRTNTLGSLDLSNLKGYTDEYYDAINVWLLDQIQAVKWVSENIESFGGNTDNVTLCGQSCGGMGIAYMLSKEETHKYFQKAIIESGVPFICQISKEKKEEVAQSVFDAAGVDTLDEFLAISEKDLKEKHIGKIFEAVGVPADIYADGKIIPGDWWDKIREGSAKDITVMMGCTAGESDGLAFDYKNMPNVLSDENEVWDRIAEKIEKKGGEAAKYLINPMDDNGNPVFDLDAFLATGDDNVKSMVDLYNAISYLQGDEYMGEALSEYTDVYLYLWEFAPDKEELIAYCKENNMDPELSPYGRPLHCMDLVFALGNVEDGYDSLSGDADKLPEGLTEKTQATWYAFVKNGNPNNDLIPEWNKYNATDREIMMMNSDWQLVKDPRSAQRKAITLRPQNEK